MFLSKRLLWGAFLYFVSIVKIGYSQDLLSENFDGYILGQNYSGWDYVQGPDKAGTVVFDSAINSKVLRLIDGTDNSWTISSNAQGIVFECDIYFQVNKLYNNPESYGASFANMFITGGNREMTTSFFVNIENKVSGTQTVYSDCYYGTSIAYAQLPDVSPNRWYHLLRIFDKENQKEVLEVWDNTTLEGFSCIYNFFNNKDMIDGISFIVANWPNYECSLLIDNISIQEIPEPATMLLLGLGGLLIRRK